MRLIGMSSFEKKGVQYIDGKVSKCLFCRIRTGEEPGKIVYNSDSIFVFHTIAPATKEGHYLISPTKHVQNITSLFPGEEDKRSQALAKINDSIQLLEKMKEVGEKVVDKEGLGNYEREFCFHIPPYNSIDHLHMHMIINPKGKNWANYFKYYVGSFFCHSSDDVLQQLHKAKMKVPGEENQF